MKAIATLLTIFFFFLSVQVEAQITYDWRSEAISGVWNNSTNWWDGMAEILPAGNEELRFDNNVQTTMTNNLAATARYLIIFTSNATDSRTIGGSTVNTFFDFSGGNPKIENQSSALHTINFPIQLGFNPLEINPAMGDLTISDAITNAGAHFVDVYSTNASTLSITSTFSGAGGMAIKDGALVIFSGVDKAYTGATTIENGTLRTSVSIASSSITIQNGAKLEINGNLSVERLSIQAGGTVEILAGASLVINGDFDNNGSFLHNNEEVTFSGSSLQTISGSSATEFATLTINNINNVVLSQSISITSTLNLANGKVTLGTNNLTINSGGGISVSAPDNNKMIETDASGALINLSASGTLLFPIGSTTYTPVTITSSLAEDFSARVIAGVPSGVSDPNKVVNRQWELTRSGAGSVDVELQWNAGEHAPGFSTGEIIVIGNNDGTEWVETTAIVSGSDPYTASASFTSFSSFAVGNQTALPVVLVSFSARKINEAVKLLWQTASESNNAHFDIHHSTDSRQWKRIGQVKGEGTTTQAQFYTFEDKKPYIGHNYYRLKQVDYDGAFSYSPIVSVNNEGYNIDVFPNPGSDYIELSNRNFREGNNFTVLIMNTKGQLVSQTSFNTSSLKINISDLPAALYVISIRNSKGDVLFSSQLSKL